MARTTYLKFDTPVGPSSESHAQQTWWIQLLRRILPAANPDFEDLFEEVITWYVEYDIVSKYTNREVGLGEDGTTLTIAPYRNNMGLWTDEDLNLDDYKQRLQATPITAAQFEEKWQSYYRE